MPINKAEALDGRLIQLGQPVLNLVPGRFNGASQEQPGCRATQLLEDAPRAGPCVGNAIDKIAFVKAIPRARDHVLGENGKHVVAEYPVQPTSEDAQTVQGPRHVVDVGRSHFGTQEERRKGDGGALFGIGEGVSGRRYGLNSLSWRDGS
jgi:hypothetical protein